MKKSYISTYSILICFLFFVSHKSFATSLSVASGQTVTVSSTSFAGVDNLTIAAGGVLIVTGNLTITASATAVNNGTIQVSGIFTVSGNASFTNNGTITSGGDYDLSTSNTLSGTGSITVGGNLNLSGNAHISVSTNLSIAGNLTLTGSSSITNSANISVGGSVSLSGNTNIAENGELTVNGNLTVAGSSTVSGSGTATINGTATTSGTSTVYGHTANCTACAFNTSAVELISPCNFKYSRLIRIDHTKVSGGASLTNFPVLITTVGLGDQSLFKSVANGGHVYSSTGYDINFTASDGITPLSFQLENYIPSTGEYEAWVNIPSLSNTTDTYIYMYYGNTNVNSNLSSPNAWNSNYVGVWHLDEDPSGTAPQYSDATSVNPENGTTHNMTAANKVAGLISNASYFDGNSDYVTFSVNSLPANNAAQTISAWVNFVGTNGNNQNFVVMENGGSGSGQQLGFRGSTLLEWAWGGGTLVAAPSVPSAGSWHYCVYTYDGSLTNSIYVDGVLKATSTTTPQTGVPTILAMGCYMSNPTSPGGEYYNGTLDEVHVLTSVLSAGWIATEYASQNSPSTFCYIPPEPNVWLGTNSTSWNSGNNWSSTSVPASGATVIIANSASNQPTVNTNVQVGSISIQSGATVTIGAGNSLSVYNDIINCGTLTSAATGTLVLNSTSTATTSTNPQTQNISSSGTYSLSNLTINNTYTSSPAVTLNIPLSLSGALNLTSGTLNTTATNILTMQNGATTPTTLTAASTSYVNGPMTYQLASNTNTNLYFPIGTSPDCRPFKLNLQHSTTNLYNYTAQLINASSFSAPAGSATYINYPATVDTLSGVHYYSIARTNSVSVSSPSLELSGNQQIQLFFGTNDQVYNGSLLTICKTYTNTTDWVDIGRSATSIGTSSYTTAQAGSITSSTSGPTAFNSFSYFTLGRLLGAGKNPLPIELLTFNAAPEGESVALSWETVTEINNNYFTVERSKDGQVYTTLLTLPSKAANGNSTKSLIYQTTDADPIKGFSYYRLKQTDYNGRYTYSKIVPVSFEGSNALKIYPNPNDGSFVIEPGNTMQQTVQLYDISGKLVLSRTINGKTNIDAGNLNNGVYNICISSANGTVNKRLVIAR